MFRVTNFLCKTTVLRESFVKIAQNRCRCALITLDRRKYGTNSHNLSNDNTSTRIGRRWLLYGAVSFGILGYYSYKYRNSIINILPTVHGVSVKNLRAEYNFIADAVESSAGAVVCIDITNTHRLDYFNWGPSTMTNGSGFIIDESGLVLTNAHVVMGHPQSAIQVKLANGISYPGRVEDIDAETDIASIRIINPKGKLPVLKLGESKTLRPGEWVIAMGSPLSLSNTITAGIVSSPHRTSEELQLGGKERHYIQTDASITFGNSGGPLINLNGEVVGINSMKVAQAGISFALPVEYAKDFLERSKNRKFKGVTKKYLGMTMLTLNSEILEQLQQRGHYVPQDLKQGALVWKIVLGSPAQKSGLSPGDIVTEINGKPIKSSNEIYKLLEDERVLSFRFYRYNTYYETVVYPEDVA